ncbi:MAG: hypothetical protein NTV88_06230 [Candidatus Micrarchaeota archaeon]|nr:hypothetical protein [Candidatus Micrarchaeota archaeon]
MKGAQAVKKELPASENETKQSKLRTFMRQKIKEPAKKAWKRTKEGTKTFGKFLLRHPKTVLAATAITVMLLTPVKTNAQDISGKTELASDKEPTDKTPMSVRIGPGTNALYLGTYFVELDLSKLGVSAFDGTEIDVPVKTPDLGWVHYLLNKNWTGMIAIVEPTGDGATTTKTWYTTTSDGSKTSNPSKRVYTDDIFAIPTEKGVIIWSKSVGYIPLTSEFGRENLDLKLEIKSGDILATDLNTNEKVKIDLATGKTEKVIAGLGQK